MPQKKVTKKKKTASTKSKKFVYTDVPKFGARNSDITYFLPDPDVEMVEVVESAPIANAVDELADMLNGF